MDKSKSLQHDQDPDVERNEEEEDQFARGATAGPSSPSRRRRRPSASRKRSSSITAATSLISSYSKSPTEVERRMSSSSRHDTHSDEQAANRRPVMNRKGTSDIPFAGGAVETFHEARDAIEHGVASPYHVALVTLLGSLAQGMPLASMFRVYSFTMCRVYQAKQGKETLLYTMLKLPPAPELPSSPLCDDPWVQKATSTYAAAMATVGALLGLVLLDRCSRLSRRFGRKPLMLLTHFLVAFAFIFFRISVSLPAYTAAVVLYIAVMILEASAGAPLRMTIQNYVVDTTSETQRAGALSFIEGFSQLGAFPSTTMGGLLAPVTQQFFAPFYATIGIYIFTMIYVLIFVPESKRHRHHTMIDDWEHGAGNEEEEQSQTQVKNTNGSARPLINGRANADDASRSSEDDSQRQASYISTAASEETTTERSTLSRLLRRFNFLAPLTIFFPFGKSYADGSKERNWTLFNLALIVIFEESFQTFLVPILLLYNTQVFQFDVVQNGYLISLLQGTRALFLTAIFPPSVAKAREWIGKRHGKSRSTSEEQQALLRDEQDHQGYKSIQSRGDRNHSIKPGQDVEVRDMANEEEQSQEVQDRQAAKKEERGKLDVFIMLFSYLLCTFSFLLLCLSRSQKDHGKIPAWITLGIAIIGIELGSGATSVRTALIVNAVGENQDQSKALAANQILCTGVAAIVPLITSSIFGLGLQMGKPELVWVYKAIMAALAAASTIALLFTINVPIIRHS